MARQIPRRIHGRKPGRGVRPFLLIPKVLCVGAYFGGLLGATTIWAHRQLAPGSDGAWQVQAVSLLFRWLVIPALVLTIGFGVLLLLQHGRILLAMRWLRVKLALLAVALPTLHLTMRPLLARVRAGYADSGGLTPDAQSAGRLFSVALAAAMVVAISAIFLGRHKPRLGQSYARTLPKPPTHDAGSVR